jgi:hypothetical protein
VATTSHLVSTSRPDPHRRQRGVTQWTLRRSRRSDSRFLFFLVRHVCSLYLLMRKDANRLIISLVTAERAMSMCSLYEGASYREMDTGHRI